MFKNFIISYRMIINRNKKGFTLVELMVVMAIIALLSVLAAGAISMVKKQANDTRRKKDLENIKVSLIAYNIRYKTWMEDESGTGYMGRGIGWFNYSGGSYPAFSMAQYLVDQELASTVVIDPTGGRTSTPTAGFTYMKYHCTISGSKKVYLFAKLENAPQSDTATDGTCCSTCDSLYGMNYVLEVI